MTDKNNTYNIIEISKDETIMLYEAMEQYRSELIKLKFDSIKSSIERDLFNTALKKESEIRSLINKIISANDLNELKEMRSQFDKKLNESSFWDDLPF